MLRSPNGGVAANKSGIDAEPVSKPPSSFLQKVSNVAKGVATGAAIVGGLAVVGGAAYTAHKAYQAFKPVIEAASTVHQVAKGTYNPTKLEKPNALPEREKDWTDTLTNVLLPGRTATAIKGSVSKPAADAHKPIQAAPKAPVQAAPKAPTQAPKAPTPSAPVQSIPGGLPGGW